MQKRYFEKGNSPVISILLMFALVVALSGIVASGIDFSKLKQPVISFLQSSGAIVPHKTGMRKTSQIVKIYNIGGEEIEVGRIKLMISVFRDSDEIGFETCYGFPVLRFGDAICSGDDIIDKSYLGYEVLGELHEDGDGVFSAGEFIGFRIKASKNDGIQLKSGDVIAVRVYDMTSGLVIAEIERRVE